MGIHRIYKTATPSPAPLSNLTAVAKTTLCLAPVITHSVYPHLSQASHQLASLPGRDQADIRVHERALPSVTLWEAENTNARSDRNVIRNLRSLAARGG